MAKWGSRTRRKESAKLTIAMRKAADKVFGSSGGRESGTEAACLVGVSTAAISAAGMGAFFARGNTVRYFDHFP